MNQDIALITEYMDKVLEGGEITREMAEKLLDCGKREPYFLIASADRIRRTFCGDEMHFCSDVNARSGRCAKTAASARSQAGTTQASRSIRSAVLKNFSKKPVRQKPMAPNDSASSPAGEARPIPNNSNPSSKQYAS